MATLHFLREGVGLMMTRCILAEDVNCPGNNNESEPSSLVILAETTLSDVYIKCRCAVSFNLLETAFPEPTVKVIYYEQEQNTTHQITLK